ncbi:hypothetical protein CHS0354_004632 [Potamilus streckersoni]|uniref:EGF-like domain-containing protein n=1 Tax=Potamilus streckersoni TaxID=2493646 RepID=A0AAE0VPE3_9BIVA|nr:hypothetical protein CHS0354_004632 [Potamilus streckersoni]
MDCGILGIAVMHPVVEATRADGEVSVARLQLTETDRQCSETCLNGGNFIRETGCMCPARFKGRCCETGSL